MAGIDKIYGSQAQYNELEEWLKANRPSALVHLYDKNAYSPIDRPISNFPTSVDKWLLKHCPLRWVEERIKEQYNNELNFSVKHK